MSKENVSVLEIFGPVIIGPSSSHTAGVGRIAFLTRKMFGSAPGKVVVRFYGSLASTWKGHGSGNAVVAGLLGIHPEDERLFQGMALLRDLQARGEGFPVEIVPVFDAPPSWHPNTVGLELFGGHDEPQKRLAIRASSIGGGSLRFDEINGYQVNLSGELEALLVLHHDEIGVIAIVSHILAARKINIAATSSHRTEKGEEAMLVVETDGAIPDPVIQQIQALPQVYTLIRVPSLAGI
jgi:L-serine dehydratase